MTTICRAVTRETELKTVGLCHEITITQFLLSLLLDVSFLDLTLTVGGVNHLPFVTATVDVSGDDGFERLRAVVADGSAGADEPLATAVPAGLDFVKVSEGPGWTRGDLLQQLAAEAGAVRPVRRAPRRRRPPPRRVLPQLPDRGLRVGGALGDRAHVDRRPRA